jgi:hypothetical protein
MSVSFLRPDEDATDEEELRFESKGKHLFSKNMIQRDRGRRL